MNLWWISSLFFAGWWLAALGLLAWRKALYFTPKERERPPRTRVFGILWGLLTFAPTVAALCLAAAGDFRRAVFEGFPDMGFTKSFLAVAVAGAIPQFAFTLLVTVLAVRQNKVHFPDLSRRDMAITALPHAPGQVLIATVTQAILVSASGACGEYGFMVTLGAGITGRGSRHKRSILCGEAARALPSPWMNARSRTKSRPLPGPPGLSWRMCM